MTTTKPRTSAKRVIVALGAVLAMTLAIVIPPHAARAAFDGDLSAGRFVTGVGAETDGLGFWLGGYELPGNVEQGYPAWCIHMWRTNPQPSHSATVATLTTAQGWAPSDISLTVPQAAWMLNKYQASYDGNNRAALSYLMHANFEQPDPETGHPDAQASVGVVRVFRTV